MQDSQRELRTETRSVCGRQTVQYRGYIYQSTL